MTNPPPTTFSFNSPSGPLSVTIAQEMRNDIVQVIAPLGTPNTTMAVLLAAARTWCNECPWHGASVDNSTIVITFPLASSPLDTAIFAEGFSAGLLQSGIPTSQIVTRYGTLAYYQADGAHPQDTLRFLSLLDLADQNESFANISKAAEIWNEHNPHSQIACTRVNGIITIAAVSGQTFTTGDMEGMLTYLRPSSYRAMQAAAAPMPIPQEPEPPSAPPSIPINAPGDEEELESVGA